MRGLATIPPRDERWASREGVQGGHDALSAKIGKRQSPVGMLKLLKHFTFHGCGSIVCLLAPAH